MHVITKRRLKEFWHKYPDAETSLLHWYVVAKQAIWHNFAEIKEFFATADQVGSCTIFNISGNKYRLIVRIEYKWEKIYVRQVLTHSEYDKGKWKDEC